MVFITAPDITYELIDILQPIITDNVEQKKRKPYRKRVKTDIVREVSCKTKKCKKTPEAIKLSISEAMRKWYANLSPEQKIKQNEKSKIAMRKSKEKKLSNITPEEFIHYKEKRRDIMRRCREKQRLQKLNITTE
jgi:hypothetical protein